MAFTAETEAQFAARGLRRGPANASEWNVTLLVGEAEPADPAGIGRLTFRIAGPGVVAVQEIERPGGALWEWDQLLSPAGGQVRFVDGGGVAAHGGWAEFESARSPAGLGGSRCVLAVPRAACEAALRQARDRVAEAQRRAGPARRGARL